MNLLQVNVRLNGGAARVARTLHEAALRAGWSSAFAYGYGPKGRVDPQAVNQERTFAVTGRLAAFGNFLSHRVVGIDAFRPQRAGRKRLLAAIAAADVVHLHAIHSYLSSYRWLLAALRESGKPVVWTAHDSWLLTGRCAITGECQAWTTGCGDCRFMGNYPAAFVDASRLEAQRKRTTVEALAEQLVLVSVSLHMVKRLSHVFPALDIRVIRNGVDEAFQESCESRRLDTDDSNDKAGPRIVVAAADLRDDAKTDIELVNQVVSNLNARLVAIGSNSPFLGPNVTNLGVLTDRRVLAEAMASADAMLFTSTIDNFPLVVLEALCVGTPVIAVRSPAADEVLGLVGGRAMTSSAVRGLRSATFSPLNLYSTTSRRGLAARARAAFSQSLMVDSYFSLYRELVCGEMD